MGFLLSAVIFIFLGGFFLSLLLPWIVRLWLKRVQKRFQRDGYDAPSGTGAEAVHGGRKRKRIDQSEGDYIEFEEIK